MESFPLPLMKKEGIFLSYVLWEFGRVPRSKFHSIVETLMTNWVPLELLTLRLVHKAFTSNLSIEFQVFLHCFAGFCCWVSAPSVICDSFFFTCLSLQYMGQQFALCSLLSWIQEELLVFLVCSTFYLLLGWSGDF